jgi:hypothetical protein
VPNVGRRGDPLFRISLDHHQPVGVRIRQWLEQNGIHRTKNGHACADTKRQRKNADKCKTRIVE